MIDLILFLINPSSLILLVLAMAFEIQERLPAWWKVLKEEIQEDNLDKQKTEDFEGSNRKKEI